MKRIEARGIKVIIYEPALKENELVELKVIKDLDDFKNLSDLILTNRMSTDLSDVEHKVYTRDLFNAD